MSGAGRQWHVLDGDGTPIAAVSVTALGGDTAGVVETIVESIVADQPEGCVRETGGEVLEAETTPRASAFGALQLVERYDDAPDCRTTYRPRHGEAFDAEMLVARYDDGEWHEVGIADIPTLEVNGVRGAFDD